MKTLFLLLILFFIHVSISKLVYKVVGVPDQNFTANEFLILQENGSDFNLNSNPSIFIDYNDGNKVYMYVTCWQSGTYHEPLLVLTSVNFSTNGTPTASQPKNLSQYIFPNKINSTTFGPGACWIKNPRVVYWEENNKTYFMFYDVTCNNSSFDKIAFSTNLNPWNQATWNQSFDHIPAGGSSSKFQCPSVLFATAKNGLTQHYLFYGFMNTGLATLGDYNIFYFISNDGYNWQPNEVPLASTRNSSSYFDKLLVTPGPPPIQLGSGDFLLLYMGMGQNNCTKIGYLILDGTQPINYTQRSETPIFPDIDACMFASGMIPHPTGCPDNLTNLLGEYSPSNVSCFWIAFGIGSNVGSARIIVAWEEAIIPPPTTSTSFILSPKTTTYSSTIGTTTYSLPPTTSKSGAKNGSNGRSSKNTIIYAYRLFLYTFGLIFIHFWPDAIKSSVVAKKKFRL